MKNIFVVCITCIGGRLIYDIIKAIRDADDYDVKIIGIDSDKNAAGRLLCDEFYIVPHSEIDPNGWLKGIYSLNKIENIDGLITFSEGESRLVGNNSDIFEELKIKLTVNSNNLVKILTDKFLLLSNKELSSLENSSETLDLLQKQGFSRIELNNEIYCDVCYNELTLEELAHLSNIQNNKKKQLLLLKKKI